MESFFDCIRSAVTVALSIAALLTLHWSLLAASFVTTVIMLFVPKLFHRKMEHLGAICTREQSAGVNQPKELMSGYDVLCFFGREERFIREAEQASGRMEQPGFRLAYKKGFVGAGVGCVNIICQMFHVALIGVLSVQGIILQGALTGGGNLCGNLSAGLGNMAQDVLSMTSAKPFFEKLSAYDGNGRVGRLIMFKECLKNEIVPFIIGDDMKMYYYRGLNEWKNEKGYLTDTCLTAQDRFKKIMNYFRIS